MLHSCFYLSPFFPGVAVLIQQRGNFAQRPLGSDAKDGPLALKVVPDILVGFFVFVGGLGLHFRTLESAAAIRDGGDEFLLIGSPTASGLGQRLDALRARWPTVFRERFGDRPPVAPRIVIGRSTGRDLIRARERLGRAIAPLKNRAPAPSPEGVLHDLDQV